MRVRLVKNARQAWRWFSVQVNMIGTAAAIAWTTVVPEDMRAAVPTEWLVVGAMVLWVLGTIGRLIDQTGGDDA